MLSPVVIATVLSPIGWISRPQALLGTKIEDIQGSFKGEALQTGTIAQASTANFIWTYNPEGTVDTVKNSCLNPPADPPAPTERALMQRPGQTLRSQGQIGPSEFVERPARPVEIRLCALDVVQRGIEDSQLKDVATFNKEAGKSGHEICYA